MRLRKFLAGQMAPLGNRPPAEFFDARKSPRPFRTAANDNGNVNNFMWVTRPNFYSTGEWRPLAAGHFYFAVLCSHDPSLTHVLEDYNHLFRCETLVDEDRSLACLMQR